MSVGIDSKDIVLALAVVGGLIALLVGVLIWIGFTAGYAGLFMIGFAILLFGAAAIARRLTEGRSEFSFAIANSMLLILLVTAAWFAINVTLPASWLGFAIGLIVAVQTAAYLFARYRRRFLQRVFQRKFKTHPFERRAEEHSFPYLAIPLGCFTGAIAAAFLRLDALGTIRLTIALSMGLLVLGIFIVTVREAALMAKTYLLATDNEWMMQVSDYSTIEIGVPRADSTDPAALQRVLDGICIASDFRQLLLLNQYALLTTLLACAIGLSAITGTSIGAGQWVLVILLLAAALVQLPYLVGQLREHDYILDTAIGTKRQELKERLQKLAPPIPALHSCVGFMASGGAGGVLGKLLEKTLEGLVTGKP